MRIVKWVIVATTFVLSAACSKESSIDTSSSTTNTSGLYVPTSSDTTVNATLSELQQGRTLYINNCGKCHSLYSPDLYSVSNWESIISDMAPRTSLTSAQILLVTKYVCRGKQ
ncbi:MAG TPA: hypothetical protein VIH57_01355 [Bacteroidales bacterium]